MASQREQALARQLEVLALAALALARVQLRAAQGEQPVAGAAVRDGAQVSVQPVGRRWIIRSVRLGVATAVGPEVTITVLLVAR